MPVVTETHLQQTHREQLKSWKPASLSLHSKSVQNNQAEKKEEKQLSENTLVELNQQNLLKVWSELVSFFKSDSGILFAIGVKYKPVCTSDSVIVFRTREKNEANVLQQHREYLLKSFLQHFNVEDLEIEIVVDSNANVDLDHEFMSDEELYEDIRKKNPSLKNWLDELGI